MANPNDERPRGLMDRRPAPDAIKGSVEKARARTLKRAHGPLMLLVRDGEGSLQWDWPFDETDDPNKDWKWLVVDAFGTRSEAVAAVFMQQLVSLCGQQYDRENEEWVPDEGELIHILHIASANRPRNEAEAALAAQMAATHLLTMKVAKQVGRSPWDSKMVGAYARLISASAAQHETMATLKGKRRTTKQQITVRHEKHVHQHQHVHISGGGVGDGHQSEAPMGEGSDENGGSAALSGQDKVGSVVPLRSRQR